MSTISGELVRVTWLDGTGEATLEIRHDDGSMTFMVAEINRMTNRIPAAEIARRERDRSHARAVEARKETR